ncbi:MAG: hypothetical protein DKM50_09970 [Candidatus Margulisiibacteriota bacterium]|nr:MAG: hypothetical protein A2X43_04055 [Candidatus Margulisbacteria bacterium GWD2_39_127]OGI05174.1 MAG: hypothetical protein A2X42_02565 [Candidatus Margulisbacteria bacterium GWF2_38_17]OGI06223.1 MAG: hypothetical protein A2X41_08145 [Candidatus Margulisbacteria bacterium GWE2_39_32]PZM78879.1 MAG: hypothetical protein DKM50_09970 [Candidatus Margulisiibacteriota bacterium]HAR64539.1 hypothetical protein [Candidatus Margulisiibacteriota bacterium]
MGFNKIIGYVLLLSFMVSSLCYAAESTIDFSFHIPFSAALDVDKFDVDFGAMDMYDEIWAPVGDSNSFKVYARNNSGSNWQFSMHLIDDLHREEGVSSPQDIIKAGDVFWTLVYAGYYDSEAKTQVGAKNELTRIPGMVPTILQKSAFQTSSLSNSALVFNNNVPDRQDKSYNYQFVFKFIMKPPFNTNSGDYRGTIVFTMMTQ